MYSEDESEESRHNIGPQRLIDSLNSDYQIDFTDKYLLTEQSKFKNALDKLQEDYRPSESVSCRDKQKKIIEDYLQQSLTTQGCSQSLYISGMPGIGKTLCVKEVVGKLQKQNKDTMVSIYTNALCLKHPIEIFRVIYFHLTDNLCQPHAAMYKLNQYFEKGIEFDNPTNRYQQQFFPRMQTSKEKSKYMKMKKIIILDEVDYLKTRNEQVLYNIFDWTQKKKSKLIIISISNTTNLPDLLSPKVNSRMGNKRLVFPQYESFQIQKILKERIYKLQVFDDQAITFTCKKIAQCSSDIRKSLSVLRSAICEFIYQQKSQKKNLKDEDIKGKKITVQILSNVMDKIYRDLFVTSFKDFPQSYKIVLYFLAKHFRNQTGACTMRKLQHICWGFTKNYNQLLPTLIDLKELGIINIIYSSVKREAKFGYDFINMKQLRQQHIYLNIEKQRIVYALQKEDLSELSKGSFRIDLEF